MAYHKRSLHGDGCEQPAVVEPVDPFQRRVFDGLERSPRSLPVDHRCPFGEAQDRLVNAIDRLDQSVVIAVADTADRRFDARFGEAFGVLDRDVWLPRSEWWMRPPLCVGRRSWSACSSASRTKPAWAVRLARQPTISRANVSMTNAT